MAETYRRQWQGDKEWNAAFREEKLKVAWQEVQAENPQEAMEWDKISAPLLDGGQAIVDSLPAFQRDLYEGAFRIADEGYRNGRVEATAKGREIHWKNWCTFVAPVGVDPYLQETPFEQRVRMLTGFAGLSRTGYYGRGKQVASGTVSSALTAVGKKISLASNVNPLKDQGGKNFVPRIQEMLEGWSKDDPPTTKMLPVEADVPEWVCKLAMTPGASEQLKATADSMLYAFYFLLRIGEYTKKHSRNDTKQTRQFKIGDCTFFKRDKFGRLRQLSRRASFAQIMTADSVTLKLDNQKNGWKGVCVHHETNGEVYMCPVRAIGRRFCHIRAHSGSMTTLLSAYFMNGVRYDVMDEDVRVNIKLAATALNYLEEKGIAIDRINTHSLRSGGANALSLAGYSDRQIQKMGRWKGATFKEYIREELAGFSAGMSTSMKKNFKFVNIAGGAHSDVHDVTDAMMLADYDTPAPAA